MNTVRKSEATAESAQSILSEVRDQLRALVLILAGPKAAPLAASKREWLARLVTESNVEPDMAVRPPISVAPSLCLYLLFLLFVC